MSYWEAVPLNAKVTPMIHTSKRCRQLRKAQTVREVDITKGRRVCTVCKPILTADRMREMRRIAYDDLRCAVREVMGKDAAAAVLAKMEG